MYVTYVCDKESLNKTSVQLSTYP